MRGFRVLFVWEQFRGFYGKAPGLLVFFTVGNSCERATNGNSFSFLGPFSHFLFASSLGFVFHAFLGRLLESLPFLQVYKVCTTLSR